MAAVADLRTVGLHPNFWYPLAVPSEIKRGSAFATSFADDPIVLVRTETNKIFALEDRCAHRQVPLSRGLVVGESLQCCYHAWRYDKHGACSVPYLPEGAARPPAGVRSYPACEAYGLVFVFPGDPKLADAVPIPRIPEFGRQSFTAIHFSRHIECHYSFMHENLMDMSHQVLHSKWMGRFNPKPLAFRKDDHCVEVDYAINRRDGSLVLRSLLPLILRQRKRGSLFARRLSGSSDARSAHEDDLMTIATHYPYQSLRLRPAGSDEPVLHLWLAYVPTGREQKANKPRGVLLVRKPSIPWLVYILRPIFQYITDAILEEDRDILEAEQRAYDLQGSDWNQEVMPFILALRELLREHGIPHRGRSQQEASAS